jgi:hypothetical protein
LQRRAQGRGVCNLIADGLTTHPACVSWFEAQPIRPRPPNALGVLPPKWFALHPGHTHTHIPTPPAKGTARSARHRLRRRQFNRRSAPSRSAFDFRCMHTGVPRFSPVLMKIIVGLICIVANVRAFRRFSSVLMKINRRLICIVAGTHAFRRFSPVLMQTIFPHTMCKRYGFRILQSRSRKQLQT